MTSHFEAYVCAITEQEIGSKYLIHRREKLHQQPSATDNKCWLCKKEVDDVIHILSICSKMSSRYYLPLRHDIIAKYVYEQFRKKSNPDCKLVYNENQFIFIEKEGQMEFWWNVSITTPAKVKHNKPDLLKWCRDPKTCQIVEFSSPADVNMTKKIQEKEDNYGLLIRILQVTYPEYRFLFIPVAVGVMGAIPIDLKSNIKKLGFDENEAGKVIKMILQKSIIESVKICKTFINFKT